MKCPDHAKELKDLRCPTCLAELMASSELESRVTGGPALLAPDPKARVKPRACPQCSLVMVPLRIGKAEAFIERCTSCESLWVEKSDLRTLEMLAKSAARQAAYASMTDAEKKELAQGLAEATKVDTGPDVGIAQTALSVATGVPMLDRLQGDKFPFLTCGYAAVLVAMYVLFDAKDLAYVSGSGELGSAFTAGFAHFGLAHLLGNVAFLFVFGSAAEKKLPHWVFLVGVLLLGPTTALLQSLDAEGGTLIGGASGVIAALLGACLFLQPKARATLFVKLQPVYVPLWAYGIFWAVLQWLFWASGRSGVGWVAHLSGFGAGLVAGFVMSRVNQQLPAA